MSLISIREIYKFSFLLKQCTPTLCTWPKQVSMCSQDAANKEWIFLVSLCQMISDTEKSDDVKDLV